MDPNWLNPREDRARRAFMHAHHQLELRNALGWEKSRLSHQVRGMQSRELNPADARSTMVCLLPAGRATIENAAPGHVADVRRNFIDLFTPAELDLRGIRPTQRITWRPLPRIPEGDAAGRVAVGAVR
jgi:DNA-binding MarR family transcriptional regulator